MKKIAPMLVLLVVVLSLSTTYAIIQAQRAPIWQIKLDNYVKYRNDILVKDPQLSGTVTVVEVTAASHPENFHQSRDKKLVAGNHYWLLENTQVLSSAPKKVICALLEERSRANGDTETKLTYQPLFLAYFSHPIEPEWLIYQGNNIVAIGCDLPWPRKTVMTSHWLSNELEIQSCRRTKIANEFLRFGGHGNKV